MNKLPVSVIFLTLNEEYHLPEAIENVKPWASDIFVVDSFSKDRTVEIARDAGATVFQHPFKNFGDQWNFALNNLNIRTDWTMKMDPDERVSKELVNDFENVLRKNSLHQGYSVSLRIWFMGKPLHVRQDLLRVWRTGKCQFSNVLVNEYPIVSGSVGKLKGTLEHFDRPSLHEWYEKQNRYTTLEAVRMFTKDKMSATPNFFGNALERRMYLKKIFFAIPFRYWLLYLYYLMYRGAWRDGYEGFAWAHLRTEVMRTREFKFREFKNIGDIPEWVKDSFGFL